MMSLQSTALQPMRDKHTVFGEDLYYKIMTIDTNLMYSITEKGAMNAIHANFRDFWSMMEYDALCGSSWDNFLYIAKSNPLLVYCRIASTVSDAQCNAPGFNAFVYPLLARRFLFAAHHNAQDERPIVFYPLLGLGTCIDMNIALLIFEHPKILRLMHLFVPRSFDVGEIPIHLFFKKPHKLARFIQNIMTYEDLLYLRTLITVENEFSAEEVVSLNNKLDELYT